jgi:carboxyl-terminal processing protease
MHPTARRSLWPCRLALIAGALLAWGGGVAADNRGAEPFSSQTELWQHSLDLIGEGRFDQAAEVIERVDGDGDLADQVRVWLREYQAQQKVRRALDLEDLEKYVRYAQERIERQEYDLALSWAIRAADVAEDREAFLDAQWLQELVEDSLTKADALRQEADWRGAWDIYWRLAELFDRETRYEKLEREMRTHLRLDLMFEEDSGWEERLEKVRWYDAQRALELIDTYYVEEADFKEITERALEELLVLSESKTAQRTFERLGDELDRQEFRSRLQRRLDQVRSAPSLDKTGAIEYLRRVVNDINPQTVQLPEELVVSELMQGALEPLDDPTSIIWPVDAEEFDKHTRGDFPGVGISIILNNQGEVEVSSPMGGTPAFRAGILPGDVIIKVDGQSLKGFSLTKTVRTITGLKGTPVTLTIRRDGEEIDFTLIRDIIKIRSVKGLKRQAEDEQRWDYWLDPENGIGYVRVDNFQANTVTDLRQTIGRLQGEGLRGLVLDLRFNPGGLLTAAYEMASIFLDKGAGVVSTRGRNPTDNRSFDTYRQGTFKDLPLVVLVDEASASGSEIVSGAIRDNKRGKVIGARTYGKGSVQNVIPLSRSNAKLKITTAAYFLPSGVSIHKTPRSETWGVEPDISVRLVHKELLNVYLMRRNTDRIGPPPKPADEADEDEADEADKADEPSDADAEAKKAADAGEGENDAELPPLEQPDENDRPETDPQLDTALLVMRATLMERDLAKIAAAKPEKRGREPAQP